MRADIHNHRHGVIVLIVGFGYYVGLHPPSPIYQQQPQHHLPLPVLLVFTSIPTMITMITMITIFTIMMMVTRAMMPVMLAKDAGRC